jgi:hypothetical protein
MRIRALVLGALVLILALILGMAGAASIVNKASAQNEQQIYLYQRGAPAALPNFVMPEAACNWTGVGGQVFDISGTPVSGLVIKIFGTLEGKLVEHFVLTGSSLQFGPGGFDVMVADHLLTSPGTLSLQLLDISGLEKSPVIQFQVFADCQHNLRVINLAETTIGRQIYFPIIRH